MFGFKGRGVSIHFVRGLCQGDLIRSLFWLPLTAYISDHPYIIWFSFSLGMLIFYVIEGAKPKKNWQPNQVIKFENK